MNDILKTNTVRGRVLHCLSIWTIGAFMTVTASQSIAQQLEIQGDLYVTGKIITKGSLTADSITADEINGNEVNAKEATAQHVFASSVYTNWMNANGSDNIRFQDVVKFAKNVLFLNENGYNAKLILNTTTKEPLPTCTPGEIKVGPGGSNSNGKGGWFFFCRLGGTWAAADFSNYGLSPISEQPFTEPGSQEERLVALEKRIEQLKAVICEIRPQTKNCS